MRSDQSSTPPRLNAAGRMARTNVPRVLPMVLAATLIARAATAAPPGAVLDYEVRYGPLQVLALRTTARFDGDHYQATTAVRTVGVVAMLFPWSAASDSRGVRDDRTMRPLRFRTAGEYRGTHRLAEIDYEGDAGPRVHIDPPAENDDRDPVPAALQEATIDPLTASLAAVSSGCRGTLRVFDGRRRYDLVLRDLGESATPPSRHTLYAGRARHCRALIQPLAGFWRSEPRHDERPTQVDYWIASPRPDLIAVPVYLELSAPRGTLAVHLSAVEPLPNVGTP
jgi:Protein of unknown function (DUF3108)